MGRKCVAMEKGCMIAIILRLNIQEHCDTLNEIAFE